MKYKKMLGKGLTAALAVTIITTSNVSSVSAADLPASQDQYQVLADTSDVTDVQTDKDYQKRPTQAANFDDMKQNYYYRVWEVPVRMYNAQADDLYSMANNALVDKAYIMVDKNGKATIKLKFQEVWLEAYQSNGHLMKAQYFASEEDMWEWYKKDRDLGKDVEVEKWNGEWSGDEEEPYPEYISFELPSNSAQICFKIDVDAMAAIGMGAQPSILGIHYDEKRELTGRELTQFYVDWFEENLNDNLYNTEKYNSISTTYYNRDEGKYYTYEEFIYKAKMWAATANEAEDKYINTTLSTMYDMKKSYLRKNVLLSAMKKCQQAEQGDYTDETWYELMDIVDSYYDYLNEEEVDEFEVVEIEKDFNAAMEALKPEGKDKYSKQLRQYIVDFDKNANQFLAGGINQFENFLLKRARNYPDKENEITCRSKLQELQNSEKNYLVKKRVIIEDNGVYSVTVIPKKMKDNQLEDVSVLNEYIDFDNAEVSIENGLPVLFLPVNDKENFPYVVIRTKSYTINSTTVSVGEGSTKQVSAESGTKIVPESITAALPMQAEAKDTKLEVSILDQAGNETAVETIYLDIDYQGAEKTDELPDKGVDKSKLDNAITQYDKSESKMTEAGYSTEEIDAWQYALKEAKKVQKNKNATQEKVDTAVQNLTDTCAPIKSPQEKYTTVYVKSFTILSTVKGRAKYTEETVSALEAAFKEAYSAVHDLDDARQPQPEDYANGARILQAAYDGLKEAGSEDAKADKTILNNKIEELKAVQADGYTEASYEALQTAIAEAEKVANDENATQEMVDSQTAALETAYGNLVEETIPEADKTLLESRLLQMKAIQAEGYTQESYQALQSAIAEAEDVIKDKNATQEMVDSQAAALESAYANLKSESAVEVDRKSLESKLAEAKAIQAAGYTEESYQALQSAIAEAEKIINDENALQEDINLQVTELQKAIDGLGRDTSVIADGTYTIPVKLMHAVSGGPSMGNAAISQTSSLTVKDQKITAVLNFSSLTISEQQGYLGQFGLIVNYEINQYGFPMNYEKVSAAIMEEWDVADSFNDPENGTDIIMKGKKYPKTVNVPIELNAAETWSYVYVPIMESIQEGSGEQVVKLTLDWSNLKEDNVAADTSALQAKMEHAKGIDTTGYTKDSVNALLAALTQAEAAVNSKEQADVKAAIEAIDKAVSGLEKNTEKPQDPVNKENLKQKIAQARTIQADGYTTESYDALKLAINAAEAVINREDASQEEVDSHAAALEAAITNLKQKELEKADKTLLKSKIAELKEIKADGYTAESYQNLQAALAEAESVVMNENATQAETDAQIKVLEAAYANLKKEIVAEVNKKLLEEKLGQMKEIQAKGYTEESYRAFTAAIEAAEKVVKNENATQEEVNSQITALETAYANLKKEDAKDVNRELLESMLVEARAIESDGYTQKSYKALQAAITQAEAAINSGNKADIIEAIDSLEKAMTGLEEEPEETDDAVDKTSLLSKITKAKAIKADGYTDTSYQALQTAVKKAEKVAADKNAKQSAVDAQVAALQKAIDSLVKKPASGTNNNNNSGTGSGGNNTNYSSLKGSSSQTSAVQTGDDTNAALPAMGVLLSGLAALLIKKRK